VDPEVVQMGLGELAAGLVVHQVQGPAQEIAPRLAPQVDVLGDVHVAGQRQVLIDHLDAPVPGVLRAGEVHGLALEDQLPLAGRVQAGEGLHEGRLAGAVVAHDPQHLAPVERQADVPQSGDRAEILVNPPGLEDRRAFSHLVALAHPRPPKQVLAIAMHRAPEIFKRGGRFWLYGREAAPSLGRRATK
jgi:hypothetical protein